MVLLILGLTSASYRYLLMKFIQNVNNPDLSQAFPHNFCQIFFHDRFHTVLCLDRADDYRRVGSSGKATTKLLLPSFNFILGDNTEVVRRGFKNRRKQSGKCMNLLILKQLNQHSTISIWTVPTFAQQCPCPVTLQLLLSMEKLCKYSLLRRVNLVESESLCMGQFALTHSKLLLSCQFVAKSGLKSSFIPCYNLKSEIKSTIIFVQLLPLFVLLFFGLHIFYCLF